MKKIVILYGGNSYEHEISCMSAHNVCKCLKKLKIKFDKIYITKDNKWYFIDNDNKIEILNVVDFLKKYSLVFPVMHGAFGEDGRIQSFLELFNINYLGSSSASSMIAMNKYLTKLIIEKTGIKQIPYLVLNENDKIPHDIIYPVIVKPVNGGSSIGINVAHSDKELKKALKSAFMYDKNIIVEKFINGIDLECGIIKSKKLIAGDIGEIKHLHEFYDYNAKYKEKSKIIIPANIDKNLAKEIKNNSLKIFEALNLNDFARIDYIYDKNNKILYFNEVNTIPGFTDSSMFPMLFMNKKIDFAKLISIILENKKVL